MTSSESWSWKKINFVYFLTFSSDQLEEKINIESWKLCLVILSAKQVGNGCERYYTKSENNKTIIRRKKSWKVRKKRTREDPRQQRNWELRSPPLSFRSVADARVDWPVTPFVPDSEKKEKKRGIKKKNKRKTWKEKEASCAKSSNFSETLYHTEGALGPEQTFRHSSATVYFIQTLG